MKADEISDIRKHQNAYHRMAHKLKQAERLLVEAMEMARSMSVLSAAYRSGIRLAQRRRETAASRSAEATFRVTRGRPLVEALRSIPEAIGRPSSASQRRHGT
jgi:hypothetical protein